MTDQDQAARLAALAARRPKPEPKATPAPTAAPTTETAPTTGPTSPRSWRPKAPSGARMAAAGASAISFAAMVVTMGPLTADAAEDGTADAPPEQPLPADVAPPSSPQVIIEVVPRYVSADGTPLTAEQLALLTTATSAVAGSGHDAALLDRPDQADPATASAPSSPPPTIAAPAPAAAAAAAAPATAAPAAAPPATTPPATAATAPPTTAAPTTAAPTTAAPTTAPPTTAAPQPTPPPRSEGSG